MDASLRELVRRRAANRCEYCRLPQTYAPIVRFHVEHINMNAEERLKVRLELQDRGEL